MADWARVAAIIGLAQVPLASQAAPESARAPAETLLIDATSDHALDWPTVDGAEAAALLRRFPDAHAKPEARCLIDDPATPAATRSLGRLMPSITKLAGAFTKAGATQSAYLIPYCESGFGAPNTVRLLVLENDQVVLDRDLSGLADRLVLARDVDGDGRAELLMSWTTLEGPRNVEQVRLLRPTTNPPSTLGRWTAMKHCSPSFDDNKSRGLRIFFRAKSPGVSFRTESVVKPCYYPPAPPRAH